MLLKDIVSCPESDSPVKHVAGTREEISGNPRCVLWRDRIVCDTGQLLTFDFRNVMGTN